MLSLNSASCLSTGTAGTRGWAGTCFSHFWSRSCSQEHEAQKLTDWHSGLALLLSECDVGKWPHLSEHNFLICKIEVINYLPHWAVVRAGEMTCTCVRYLAQCLVQEKYSEMLPVVDYTLSFSKDCQGEPLCIWLLPISDYLCGPDAQNWDSWVCSVLRGCLSLVVEAGACPP